jgi:PAS domain S-box-containing protein
VLLDLGLPESSGLETLRLVYPRFPNLPIVVLTGLDVDEVGVEAVKAGAQDYVAKDRLDGHLLVRTLRYALERARRQQAELALYASRRALRQTDAKLRNLVENIPDHVAVLAPDGRILFVNRSTPMASVDELVGANTFDFVASEHREQYRGVFQRAVDTGQVQSNVVMTIHGRWWEIRLVPMAEEKTVQSHARTGPGEARGAGSDRQPQPGGGVPVAGNRGLAGGVRHG